MEKKEKKDELAAGEEARGEINLEFDEAFSLLRQEAEKIGSDSVSLEDAIESYRRGKIYYEACRKKLDEAKQLIQIYDRDSGELKEMDAAEQGEG